MTPVDPAGRAPKITIGLERRLLWPGDACPVYPAGIVGPPDSRIDNMSSLPLAESIREAIFELCIEGVLAAKPSQKIRLDSDWENCERIKFAAAPLLLVQAMLWPIDESELLRGVGVAEAQGDVQTMRLLDWQYSGSLFIRASGGRKLVVLAGREEHYANSWRLQTLPLIGFMERADLPPSCFSIYSDGIPSLSLTAKGFRKQKGKLHGAKPRRGRPPLSPQEKKHLDRVLDLHQETLRWPYPKKLRHFQTRYPEIRNEDELRTLIDRAKKQHDRDGRK